MTGLTNLMRKELLELIRTYRFFVIFAVLIVVGLISPITAKVMPELLKRMGSDASTGFQILMLKDPDITDALIQYHKNFIMLPVLAILLSMGCVGTEIRMKIAPLTLVKPVSRSSFIMAKFFVPAVVYVVATLFSGAGCALYTYLLFGEPYLPSFAVVLLLLTLYLLSYLAVAVFASTLFRSSVASAGLAVAVYAVMSIFGSIPAIAAFTPSGLSTHAQNIILSTATGIPLAPVISSLAMIAALLATSCWIINRQEI